MKMRKTRRIFACLLAAALAVNGTGCGTAVSRDQAEPARQESGQTQADQAQTDQVQADQTGAETIGQSLPAIPLLEVDAKAKLVHLTTNGKENPLGIDDPTPSFSWQMKSKVTGAAQSAYQIKVETAGGEEVWDSGQVESQDSTDIAYEGDELVPQTAYRWTVTVTDTGGNSVTSKEASFETGLMPKDTVQATGVPAMENAQWIGADQLPLDAASLAVFDIKAKVKMEAGAKASFIIGAKDFRLAHKNFNINQTANTENYVRIEFDFSKVNGKGGAAIKAYRVGYKEGDSDTRPLAAIKNSKGLDALITKKNAAKAHDLTIHVSASTITFSIDGTDLTDKLTVNDLGGDSSYNSYPNLNSIGFAAEEGQKVTLEDYRVENGGKYGTGTLFGPETGATYSIFENQSGIGVNGNQISLTGPVRYYADPSFGASPMVRKEFQAGDIKSARLYLTAQGIYNFYINGKEVAEAEWFNPGMSEYDQILGYNTYDVTDYLQKGANVMGAQLGEGWWTGQMTYEASNSNYFGDQPALAALLVLTKKDGSQETIITDKSWQSYLEGPVRTASFFQGENYDATKEVSGWNQPGFGGDGWKKAAVIETRKQFAKAALVARTDTPVHVIRTLKAKECLGASGEDSYIYDMGENVAGVPVLTIPAEDAAEGKQLTIRYAETLYPDTKEFQKKGTAGTLMVENYRAAMVTDFYTMQGGKENVFAPDLTFHGYRYIEITGLSHELPLDNVKMQVLSSLDATGTYQSSNKLANRLFKNIVNSTTSNYISIPTDCPQRNERMGWTGDAQIFALTGTYVADTYGFLDQWMDTVRAGSGESGMSAQYAPAFVQYGLDDEAIAHNGQSFGITWNCLAVTIPYNLYVQTGNKDIITENYDNFTAYVDTLLAKPFAYKDANGGKKEDARLTGETGTLADHLSRVTTDSVLLGTAQFIACLDEAALMCQAVDQNDKAAEYAKKAEEARAAWNEIFIDPDTGKTRAADGTICDTQASYATPLRFRVISDENLEKVTANYEASIAEASGEDSDGVAITPYTLTTGFNATGNTLVALSQNGLNDTAYRLFESTDYASWLYPVTQGATSIWERWNSYTRDRAFGDNNSMNSFNHYSFGAVGEWMMADQAGITTLNGQPGYQTFVLQPTPGGDYTSLKASYTSAYGKIKSSWTAKDGKLLSYDALVPANTTATLYLPTDSQQGGQAEGAAFVESTKHNGMTCQTYQLCAGKWHFEIGKDGVSVSGR